MQTARLEALIARLGELEADAVWLSNGHDVRYLSGFASSNGHLLVSAERRIIVTDFRYRTQVAQQAPGWELVEMKPGQHLHEALVEVFAGLDADVVGFQAEQVTYATWGKLSEKLEWPAERLKPLSGVVGPLREVKDDGELVLIQHAADLADAVIERACELARPGVSERRLKAEIEYDMLCRGADQPSFETIVAGGPNSALPHAPVSDRKLQRGDLLTIDLGVAAGGYCSDITRTVAIGSCSREQQAIYDLVYRAHMAALEALRPGLKGQEADEIARAVIRDAGHEEHFGHGLGHGVGIEVHEGPRLNKLGEKELVPGHVVTVEPGVYVPGLGGVRIEDLVVITETGCRRLSRAEKPAALKVV